MPSDSGFRLGPLSVVIAALACCPIAHASPRCKGPGLLVNPAVPDPETAKTIFLAVEKVLVPSRDVQHFPRVEAHDAGDHWEVFRLAPRTSHMNGGGQLELDIAKCDGALSNVFLSK